MFIETSSHLLLFQLGFRNTALTSYLIFQIFHNGFPYRIETSPLICSANFCHLLLEANILKKDLS